MRSSFNVFIIGVVLADFIVVVCGNHLNVPHSHRHQDGDETVTSRRVRHQKRHSNEYQRKRLEVSVNVPGMSTEQWSIAVGNNGTISLIKLDDPTCTSCVMEVEFVCDNVQYANKYKNLCGRRSIHRNVIRLYRFNAQNRYLCLSAKKNLYTMVASELSSLDGGVRDCLWYDLPKNQVERTERVVYSVQYPNRDYKCRGKEIKSLRRQAPGPRTAVSTCRKLYLTATRSKTGSSGFKRRTPSRVLTVVENRTLIENDGVSLSLKEYEGDEVRSHQGPFEIDKIPLENIPASTRSTLRNSRRADRHRKVKKSTTTTTTRIPEVTTNKSNRRGSRRAHGIARRWRTTDPATTSGPTVAGGGGALAGKGDSVHSSRQTLSRSVDAIDVS